MLMQKGKGVQMHARSVCRRIFICFSIGWKFGVSGSIRFLGHFYRGQRLSLILARIVENSLPL
jgi:hypothetical protein